MLKSLIIKSSLSPNQFYPNELKSVFGKCTGDNWHMWKGTCPFHADKNAGSFVINKSSGAYKCFACGASGGDIIAFTMQLHNLSFKEALNKLWGVVSCKNL